MRLHLWNFLVSWIVYTLAAAATYFVTAPGPLHTLIGKNYPTAMVAVTLSASVNVWSTLLIAYKAWYVAAFPSSVMT